MEKRTSFRESNFTTNEENEKLYIEGYFMKYDSETNLFGEVYEEIDKHSVDKSLKENDIRGLWNHDNNLVLGRTGNNTLTLKSDNIGLWGRIEVNQDDPMAMGAYARIKRGDVAGCSFGFYPVKEDLIERSEGGQKFVIREMDLFEVSPCVFPAYPQTEVMARSKQIEQLQKRQLDAKKEQIRKRLEELKK